MNRRIRITATLLAAIFALTVASAAGAARSPSFQGAKDISIFAPVPVAP
jgi:hypothetical protein